MNAADSAEVKEIEAMSTSTIIASMHTVVPHGMMLRDLNDLSHDQGLQHPHQWARDSSVGRPSGPIATDTADWPTPSSAVHDDIHYGID